MSLFFTSKHLLVLKTSSRRPQDMSWRRLQHIFRVRILRLPRRVEDVLKTPWRHLAKTFWRRLGRRKIVTLRPSWRRLEDMSWRCLEDISGRLLKDFMETNKILTGDIYILISGFNKPKSVSNKSVFHKSITGNSKANPKCINYWWLVWCYVISLIQFRHCRKVEAIKATF